jgi:hypothetical protein
MAAAPVDQKVMEEEPNPVVVPSAKLAAVAVVAPLRISGSCCVLAMVDFRSLLRTEGDRLFAEGLDF